ncbi:MAG: hypothetical protein AAFO07_30840, partial [Bacteroidota bacterium]
MKYLNQLGLFTLLILAVFACEERENYTSGPTVLNILESVSIDGKAATIDHLSGAIQVSLPGTTNLSSVAFEATAPNGVSFNPGNGQVDLTAPVQVTVSNGTDNRIYEIEATLLPSKIAFLGDGATIADISDDDVKAAAEWT